MEILLILQTVASPHGCSHSVDDRRNGENIDERDEMETTSMKTMKMVMVKMVMIPTLKEMVMAILTKKGRLMRKPSKAIVDDSCIVDSDLQEAN